MTNIDLGVTGAKRATWRETDTRPLLQKIVSEHPSADDKQLFKLFWNEIEDDKDYLRSVAMYWFDLAMISLRRSANPAEAAQKRAEGRVTAKIKATSVGEAIKERVAHEARIILLDLIMPSGKTLGESTGAECRRFGGWLAILAKKVPAKKTVAETLSEQEVYRLWKAQ